MPSKAQRTPSPSRKYQFDTDLSPGFFAVYVMQGRHGVKIAQTKTLAMARRICRLLNASRTTKKGR